MFTVGVVNDNITPPISVETSLIGVLILGTWNYLASGGAKIARVFLAAEGSGLLGLLPGWMWACKWVWKRNDTKSIFFLILINKYKKLSTPSGVLSG